MRNPMKKLVALLLSLCLILGMTAFASAEEKTGSAQGFGSEVKVTVTVEDGKITGLDVDDSGETYSLAGFNRADTVEKLMSYEKQRISECRRESQGSERNLIYRVVSNNPLELKYVLNYTRYVMNNEVVIDFDRWIKDDPCSLLHELKSIQPVKI